MICRQNVLLCLRREICKFRETRSEQVFVQRFASIDVDKPKKYVWSAFLFLSRQTEFIDFMFACFFNTLRHYLILGRGVLRTRLHCK
jgi:hypothetical protein